MLTAICGIGMGVCWFPSFRNAAYVSIAAGSWFALKSAWESLRERQFDVNLLMVLAAAGAIVVGHPEDAAVLLFLFSLSSTLEEFALGKTKSAIEALVRLRPQNALLVRDGQKVEVPVEQLQLGDLIQVNPFDRLPTDGEIVTGTSSIDESAMTGESAPVAATVGGQVMGGTQNLEGMLTVRVTKQVGNSALDRIVELVQDAQENKASGERISQWFGQTYTIVVLAAFALSWGIRMMLGQGMQASFYSALILLVGMSPCALVISVPAATLSALAHAARRGILVRGGEFIEKAASIKIVALDKTGTLTLGRPRLNEASIGGTVWKPGEDPGDSAPILAKVAAAENYSTHPLAVALVREVKASGIEIPEADNAKTIPGKGLSATVGGGEVWVGNDRLLTENGFDIPDLLESRAAEWKAKGETTVFAAGDGFQAVFGFADEIRPEASAVVKDLKGLGVGQVVMLTGDKAETAQTVGQATGVTDISAGLLPEDKVNRIKALSEQGSVLMVGDGVNDAPSLALATLGVAMGGLGSDVALEAADVVLSHDRLDRIPELIRLGRRTKAVVTTNLVFAGAVICFLTFGSFLINLPLPVAVVCHEGSTLIVILNGLRLLR